MILQAIPPLPPPSSTWNTTIFSQWRMEPLVLESAQIIPSLKLTFSPLKIGRNPIGNNRLPTIHFQGRRTLVSGRVIFHQPHHDFPKKYPGSHGTLPNRYRPWGGCFFFFRSCFRSRANLTRWSGLLISTHWQGRRSMLGSLSPRDPIALSDDDWGVQSPPQHSI